MARAENTRTHITEVALRSLANHGYGGLTVGFVAEAAQMSKSGVFARFGGQAAFQCAVIDAAAAKFKSHVIDPARGYEQAVTRLEQVAKSWTAWLTTPALGQPCPVFQATMEGPALTAEAQAHALATRAQFPAYIARLATQATESGEFADAIVPERFAFEFDGIGLSTGFAALTQDDDTVRQHAAAAYQGLFERSRR